LSVRTSWRKQKFLLPPGIEPPPYTHFATSISTPWSRLFLRNLIGAQLVNTFLTSHRTCTFITASRRICPVLIFRNMLAAYSDALWAPPPSKMEDHNLSTVHHCLYIYLQLSSTPGDRLLHLQPADAPYPCSKGPIQHDSKPKNIWNSEVRSVMSSLLLVLTHSCARNAFEFQNKYQPQRILTNHTEYRQWNQCVTSLMSL
jgi:hypothetical protein